MKTSNKYCAFILQIRLIEHLKIGAALLTFLTKISLGSKECHEFHTINTTTTFVDLRSPNFPQPYNPNVRCFWRIQTKLGYRIRILFESFHLEKSNFMGKCDTVDYLEITELQFKTRYCGNKAPPKGVYLSLGPVVDIIFQSNHHAEFLGFHLKVTAEPILCQNIFDSKDPRSFSSPNSTHNGNEVVCIWEIKVPEDERIEIACATFNLADSKGCEQEAIIINYFGDEEMADSEKFCQKKRLTTVKSDSNRATVLFFSRKYKSTRGFQCSYKPIDSDAEFTSVSADRCGQYHNLIMRFRVIGGNKTETHIPLVGLHSAILFCGGVLITPEYILTAAHCINNEDIKQGNLQVFIITKKSPRKFIGIKRAIVHERFQHEALINDIALLQIYRDPTVKQEDVACLPTNGFLLGNKLLHVFGWGLTYEADYSLFKSALHGVIMPMANFDNCQDYYWKKHNKQLTDRVFCAGIVGKDACAGDSGGPALVIHNNRLIVVGIVSFGENNLCGDHPGVYTRVSSYVNWILGHIDDGDDN